MDDLWSDFRDSIKADLNEIPSALLLFSLFYALLHIFGMEIDL